jgi:hypothetical protein
MVRWAATHSRSDDTLPFQACEENKMEEFDDYALNEVFFRILYKPREIEWPIQNHIENILSEMRLHVTGNIGMLGEFVGFLSGLALGCSEMRPVALRQIEMLGLIGSEYLQVLNVDIVRAIVQIIAHASEMPNLLASAEYWRFMSAIIMVYDDEIVRNAALIVLHNISIYETLTEITCAVDAETLLGVIVDADATFLLRKSIAYVIFDIGIIWPNLLGDRMRAEIVEMVRGREDGEFAMFVWDTLICYGEMIDLENSSDDPLVRLSHEMIASLFFDA